LKNDFLFFDLGTENIRIFSSSHGLVYHGSSIIALNDEAEVVAYGSSVHEASFNQDIKIVYPIKNGTIANHHALLILLQTILANHYKRGFRTRINGVFSIPTFATNVEQRAYLFVAQSLDFSDLLFIPEYIFCLTSIYEQLGKFGFEFITQTGAGRFDTYLLNNGKMLYGDTQKGGFERMVADMLKKVRFEEGVQIGRKILFDAFSNTENQHLVVKGRNKVTGEVVEKTIERAYFQHLLEESLIRFSGMITEVFKRLSPDLSAEFLEKGLRLTGGPINENWFIRAIEEKTGFSAVISDTPGEDILRGFKLISSDLQRDQLEKFNLLNNGNEVRG